MSRSARPAVAASPRKALPKSAPKAPPKSAAQGAKKTAPSSRPVAKPARATAGTDLQRLARVTEALSKSIERTIKSLLGRTHPLATLVAHHGLSAATALGLGTWLEQRLTLVTPQGHLLVGLRLADRIQHALDTRVLTPDSIHYARHIQGERNRFAHEAILPQTVAPRLINMLGAAMTLDMLLPPAPRVRGVAARGR